jgi:tetratricopeptide (TPR) repeat protein
VLFQSAKSNLDRLEGGGLREAAEADLASCDVELPETDSLPVHAYRAASYLKDQLLQARALTAFARVQIRQRKIDEAMTHLEKACHLSEPSTAPDYVEANKQARWELDFCLSCQNEAHVQDLLSRFHAAYHAHDYERALELANQTIEEAQATLRHDHWLTADAFHRRACVKMQQGFFSEARVDLDQALVILDEWPEQASVMVEMIQSNLERCRRDMGY